MPITDGVWIESKFACNSETDAYLFNGSWNAEIDFWDPVLPPMAYVSDILRVKAKTGGYTSFNDSRQIKILADGQAIKIAKSIPARNGRQMDQNRPAMCAIVIVA